MKPLIGIFPVLVALLPAPMLAETVGVRSGDHPGFTRLVIQLKGPEDWAFGRVEGGFEFRPGREDVSYRLTRVFDKIGRTRIEDVRDLGDGRLHLGVSCQCHGVVEELSNGLVVLDIVDGSAPLPDTGVDAMLPPFGVPPEGQTLAVADTPAENSVEVDAAPILASVGDRAGLPLTFQRAGPLASVAESTPEPTPKPPTIAAEARGAPAEPAQDMALAAQQTSQLPADETAEPDRATRIATTEAALLEQVARAAAQGLLDADISDIENNVAVTRPEPVESPHSAPNERPSPPATHRGHMTVETSVDRAAAENNRPGDETDDGEACIDPANFDISNWGEEIGNGADIGAYRTRLITELDAADDAGVSALVRNYIYITFGAEAKALMHRYPDSVERPDLLFAMAEIMDEGQSANASDLAGQMGCEGATALWATLAQAELKPGQTINRNAVSITFGALPAHLRRHLGPKLADNLLATGDVETADLIRTAIGRVSDVPTSEYEMLTAQFELEAGQVGQATSILDDVVASGDAVLPEALLQRVEATLGAGGAVPGDVVVLLDSLAFQFRGTDTARQMVDAAIRARASAADFSAAFAQLDAAAEAGLFSSERSVGLQQGLYGLLTRNTDDPEFLRLSLSRLEEIAGLPAPPRRALAQRLLELGLAGPARQALGSDSAMPAAVDRQLLARAALIEDRPAVAIGYLAGLTDKPALSLRADALEMAQDHLGAMRAFEATGDREKMLHMAWRGGLWADVTQLDAGTIGAAAQMMAANTALIKTEPSSSLQPGAEMPADLSATAGGPPAALDDTGTGGIGQPALAEARGLIAESAATRQTLDALLEDVVAQAGNLESQVSPGF